MARHRSAIKRHKQSEKRRLRNTAVKSEIKTAVKKVRQSVEGSDIEAAREALKRATRLLDRAVTKGVLHRNTASRKIARLTVRVNSIESGQGA